MTRSFLPTPVAAAVVDRILDAGRRAPTAGFTQGVHLIVLEGPSQTARLWDVTLPRGERRERFRWPGLLDAPVLVIPVSDPGAYVRRYAEPDKVDRGLGGSPEEWPVPYWTVDAAFAAMALQYAAVAEGVGVLFFGIPGPWGPVLGTLGVPEGFEAIGAVAIGEPARDDGAPTGSPTRRTRREADELVHRGGW